MGVFARLFGRSRAAEEASAAGERADRTDLDPAPAGPEAEGAGEGDAPATARTDDGAAAAAEADDGTVAAAGTEEGTVAAAGAEEGTVAAVAAAPVAGDGVAEPAADEPKSPAGAGSDAEGVELPRQQSASEAAGHEVGEGART
ncbi:hypothetical protein ACF1A5_25490 [Streptomyces sp. NPDC014864]|uniref:hypothetical protein n=1 Tax=Streptomyces sp. NPDC014864 TaxID=3364924 RepID=UPI0036FE88E5